MIALRKLVDADAERMLRWMQDLEVVMNLGLRNAPSLEGTRGAGVRPGVRTLQAHSRQGLVDAWAPAHSIPAVR